MIEQVFRTEWPRLVAALVRDLRDLELAEDSASEAFIMASERWPTDGVPERPAAWLLTTARRKAIDRLRRTERHADKLRLLEATARSASAGASPRTIPDDQLALILGCCHPALDADAQIALTLRAVAGLTTAQIARAFLVTEPAMAKRLTRAKHKIRATNIAFTVPAQLDERLPAALHVIYLIFTEGHTGTRRTELVRGDLCDEAVWLAGLLAELLPDEPEVQGLAALILLSDARRAARVGSNGEPVLLEDQDRSCWDRTKIDRGLERLRDAHRVGPIGVYGLQAAIAAVHSVAADFDATDWEAILEIYDHLGALQPSPIVALNRAVALSYVAGAEEALAEMDGLATGTGMADYHYLHSARAELLCRLGREDEARTAYRSALATCPNGAEQALIRARLDRLRAGG